VTEALSMKIAQGLSAHMEKLVGVVEVKGDKARLLSVAERTKALFGKDGASATAAEARAKPSKKQLGLFAEIEAAEKQGHLGPAGVPKIGQTTLDRLHQAMILFGAGRSDALRRFVVEEGAGKDARFWKLAQSFSALYPPGSDEKRWVDGVLARKKALGF
jgi:putative DNA methylase